MDVKIEAGRLSAEHGQRLWTLWVGQRTVETCWLPADKTGADAFRVMIKKVAEE